MKISKQFLASLVVCAACAAQVCTGQERKSDEPKRPAINVLAMKSVPDGNYLVNLQIDDQERLLNMKVKNNVATCVNSSDPRFKNLLGKFELIGNGVFLIVFRNPNYTASQFWLFREDGSAAIKEVPDRGEKQNAVPVENDSIEPPKRIRPA